MTRVRPEGNAHNQEQVLTLQVSLEALLSEFVCWVHGFRGGFDFSHDNVEARWGAGPHSPWPALEQRESPNTF
jgi:hypothetical protein